MYEYYCPKCKKYCNFDEELDIVEGYYEGDWQTIHIVCDEQVIETLKANINA